MHRKTITNKLQSAFGRCKRPVCPWTWRRVERLRLWIITQTGFIIKNHHGELTGTRTAGAYWLPTGGVDPSPRGVFHSFASLQLAYVPDAVYKRCTGTASTDCCLCSSVTGYDTPLRGLMPSSAFPHCHFFLHNLSAGWHLTSATWTWERREKEILAKRKWNRVDLQLNCNLQIELKTASNKA